MPAIINGFLIDATLVQDHNLPSEVTSHPVEQGADLTDHILNLPIVVTMECLVSNTPIGLVANARSSGSLPSEDAYGLMKKIRTDREPVTIESELGIFENMALRDLSLPFSADEGTGTVARGTDDARITGALKFRATFVQVEVVTNDRTTVEVSVPRAQKKVNRGNKPSPPAGQDGVPNPSKTASANRSVLDQLLF